MEVRENLPEFLEELLLTFKEGTKFCKKSKFLNRIRS